MLSFCYYDRRLCRSNCEADHQDPSPPFSAFQERALKAGIITGLSRQDLSPELCVITVSLHSGTVFTKVLPEKCVHASTSRHHSSTWPVQTCFYAPDHNNKQPQMADLCLQGRFKVTAVNKANRFFFFWNGDACISQTGRSFFSQAPQTSVECSSSSALSLSPTLALWPIKDFWLTSDQGSRFL